MIDIRDSMKPGFGNEASNAFLTDIQFLKLHWLTSYILLIMLVTSVMLSLHPMNKLIQWDHIDEALI